MIDAYSDEQPRPKKKLKPSKIRGVPSNGMVCSERELGLSEEHEGILLLPEDAPVGMPLRDYLGDKVLSLGLTVDMARCLSMIGVAREVSALTRCGTAPAARRAIPDGRPGCRTIRRSRDRRSRPVQPLYRHGYLRRADRPIATVDAGSA